MTRPEPAFGKSAAHTSSSEPCWRVGDALTEGPPNVLARVVAAFDISVLFAPAVGVVAIVVSVYLWWRGRVRKAISYRLTAPAVVSVHHGVGDEISILYADEPVRDVRLLNLRIANTGNGDIKPDDFESPFSVALGESARVLGPPTVGNTNPPELEPELSVRDQKLVIAPLLLNGSRSWRGGNGDWFESPCLSASSARATG